MSSPVTFYSSQPLVIAKSIQQGQTHYAKMHFIKEKYGETVAPIFTHAYTWFVLQGQQLIIRPSEAESAIWVYYDLHNIEQHNGYVLFELAIPLGQIIFFIMDDWNKILNQRFLGVNSQEELAFMSKLEKHSINHEPDVFRKPFYPQLKQEITNSWKNLFRFHQQTQCDFKKGIALSLANIQRAIWQLPNSWIKRVID